MPEKLRPAGGCGLLKASTLKVKIPIGSYIGTDVCTHNPLNLNNCENIAEEAHYCMVLLQQYGLYLLTYVI